MAGSGFERQETGLVRIINKAYNANGQEPFTLTGANGKSITKVIGAQKYMGRAASGSEPYTDVQILRDVVKRTSRWKDGKPSFSNIVNSSTILLATIPIIPGCQFLETKTNDFLLP